MTYEAPGPPDEEIAILEYDWMYGFYLFRMDTLKVTHIDDAEIPPWSDFALLPGSHRISFAYEEMAHSWFPFAGTVPIWLFDKSGDLILEAEAGHTYRLCIKKEDKAFYSWIYDIDTEEVVAGEPPRTETGNVKESSGDKIEQGYVPNFPKHPELRPPRLNSTESFRRGFGYANHQHSARKELFHNGAEGFPV